MACLESPLGERILIVDDVTEVILPLVRGLTNAGFQVCAVSSGADALTLLKSVPREERFHALLTDIQMPQMRGDILQRLAREHDPHLAVILITAIADLDLAVSCMRDGVMDYVTKPFRIADVLIRLRAALEKRRTTLQNK